MGAPAASTATAQRATEASSRLRTLALRLPGATGAAGATGTVDAADPADPAVASGAGGAAEVVAVAAVAWGTTGFRSCFFRTRARNLVPPAPGEPGWHSPTCVARD
ncbi:hypothetical protein GCM10009801_23370 [Streptomyces albiaxialis]|uniref:Uncharacterized protein n=1 Tax=Streptomyces albiaxialis TaxID=329523 RepID=A0ABN2VU09_9ACTN